MQLPWLPPKSSTLRWTWVDGDGPFITMRELRDTHTASFETESSSATITMFNLDSLNAERLEVMRGATWGTG